MNNHHASHRPHASWNNYRWTGTYLITIVAHEHRQVFGELRTEPEPHVDLTDMGCYMEQQWLALPDYHSQYGRRISALAHQENDRAVMAAYGFSTKMSESECVAELFKMYQELAK